MKEGAKDATQEGGGSVYKPICLNPEHMDGKGVGKRMHPPWRAKKTMYYRFTQKEKGEHTGEIKANKWISINRAFQV